jgi:hypothetical protein
MAQQWKGFYASRFVIICIRSASSFKCRTMTLFVGDSLLLAASNGTGVGLPVKLSPQRLMYRTGIEVRSQGIECGFYPLDLSRTWACQSGARVQRDYPEDKGDQSPGP